MPDSFYVPSGEYSRYAGLKFSCGVFISTAITGLLYGWLSSEYPPLLNSQIHINIPWKILLIILTLYVNITAALKLIKYLKIRNPILFGRLAFLAALPGWSLNWLSLIFLFHADWHLLLPVRLFESFFIPLIIARSVNIKAGFPFSEAGLIWHECFILKPLVAYPSKEEIKKALEKRDFKFLLSSIRPDKYFKYNPKWSWAYEGDCGGWTSLMLFSTDNKEDDIYVNIGGGSIIDRIFTFNKNDESLRLFWRINKNEIKSLVERFDSHIGRLGLNF